MQNLVVVPDIEMLFKWSVVESRQNIYDDSNRLVTMLAIASSFSVAGGVEVEDTLRTI